MKADIYVELPADLSAAPRLAVARNGRLEETSLAGFRANGQMKAVAFAPALSVARFRVPISAKTETESRLAALYAIEDDLAQPVEDVHLTLGPRDRAGANRDVYVADRALVSGWSNLLQGLGLGHAAIIPENSFAPADAVIVNFGDRLLLAGPNQTIGADINLPQEALDALVEAAGLSGARTIQASALAYLSERHSRDPGVNLAGASSEFANRTSPASFRFWRVAGGLALAAGALWMASVFVETNRLHQASRQNDDAARAAFRTQFPGAPESADVRAEVRRLAQPSPASGNGGFLPLTSALYQAISASDTIRLNKMTYDAGDGGLRASLVFASRADESAFRARLEDAGWRVETTSAADGLQGVEANLIVRAQP